MLVHMVLVRFVDPADAQEAERRLRKLRDHIDVIRHLEVGRNVIASERAFDLGLMVEFDSLEDHDTYQAHQELQPVLAFIRERARAVAACDFYR